MVSQSVSQAHALPPADPVRAGLGDPEILKRLGAVVRVGLGYQALPGDQLAEAVGEVVSESCARALAAADRYDPEQGSLLNWLGGFALNVLRERRRASRRVTVPLDESVPDRGPDVDTVVANRLDAAGVLAGLRPAEAQLLRWEAEGRSAAEIGTELGLTEGAVRARLHRARVRAREHLADTQTGRPQP